MSVHRPTPLPFTVQTSSEKVESVAKTRELLTKRLSGSFSPHTHQGKVGGGSCTSTDPYQRVIHGGEDFMGRRTCYPTPQARRSNFTSRGSSQLHMHAAAWLASCA